MSSCRSRAGIVGGVISCCIAPNSVVVGSVPVAGTASGQPTIYYNGTVVIHRNAGNQPPNGPQRIIHDLLDYVTLNRIWIECIEHEVTQGHPVSDRTVDLHVIHSTDAGVTTEDTVEHHSASVAHDDSTEILPGTIQIQASQMEKA